LKEFIDESPERKENLFRTFLGFIISGIVLELADRHGKIYLSYIKIFLFILFLKMIIL